MIHLHIGRHKTGSTALQRFLRGNRGRLADRGLTYVGAADGGPAHGVAGALTAKWRARATPARLAAADLELQTARAALDCDGDQILSSEAFQNTPPQAAAEAFPPDRTRVIVYLREQLDYLLSAYAQVIQAQATRPAFAAYVARQARRTDYPAFLAGWTAAFGAGLVIPRVYARERLEGQDIRRDVLAVIGADPDGLRYDPRASNPSIGPDLIEAKGLIDAYVPGEVQKQVGLYQLLGQASEAMPGRLRVTEAFAERVRGCFAEANADLFRTYFSAGEAGFPQADLTGAVSPIDRLRALDQALAAIEALSPEAAKTLRRHLPARPDLGAFPPLLPEDWDAAASAIEAPTAG